MYLANNFLTENFVFVLQEKRGKKYIYLQGHWKERGESYNQSHCPKNVLTRTLEGKGKGVNHTVNHTVPKIIWIFA